MDISSTGIDSDCDHEFLSDGAGIYHFPQKGTGANMRFTGFSNYQRILVDKVFQQSIGNTFFYLIIHKANHAYTCNSAGTVIKQQTFKIAGIVPNLCLPPMCDFTGFLFVDLPFDVCNRRTD